MPKPIREGVGGVIKKQEEPKFGPALGLEGVDNPDGNEIHSIFDNNN